MRKWTTTAGLLFCAAASVYTSQAIAGRPAKSAKPADQNLPTDVKVLEESVDPFAPTTSPTSQPSDSTAQAGGPAAPLHMNEDGTFSLNIVSGADLVLSDVVMPDIDGYDLFMFVRERQPDTPVVLMTAFFYDRDHVLKRSKLAGLDGILYKKPVQPERLIEIVREPTPWSKPGAKPWTASWALRPLGPAPFELTVIANVASRVPRPIDHSQVFGTRNAKPADSSQE